MRNLHRTLCPSLFSALVALSAVSACDAELPEDELAEGETDDDDETEFRVEVGVDDTSDPVRNAVVLLGNFCTGTLVAPDLVLTAAHCGWLDEGYFTGGWTNLPSAVPVNFGPDRQAPIFTAFANAVSAPPLHTGGPNWVDDIVLLRLTANVPASVAVPRPVYLDHPASLLPLSLEDETIFQIGYGGYRDRRIMTGGDYVDWLSDPSIADNAFEYVADVTGVGDRNTNIEHGDSGGPMLLDSETGPVLGVLSFWEPYGIAPYGPGTGGRSPIRSWLIGELPAQKPDFTVVSIASAGCTASGGDPVVAVTIDNEGVVTRRAWVDLFTGLAAAPTIGTYSSMYQMSNDVAPEGQQILYFAITNGFRSGWVDVLLDTTQSVDELDESNNADYRWLNLPDCSFN